jgi:hypothetical protein
MRSQVVSMVDAMASFGSSGVGGGSAPRDSQLATPAAQVQTPVSTASAGLTGMVDALKQFDANGQPKLASGMSTEAVAATLNTTTIRKPDTDILASGSK